MRQLFIALCAILMGLLSSEILFAESSRFGNDYYLRSASCVSLKSPTDIALLLKEPWVTEKGPITHSDIVQHLATKPNRTSVEKQILFEYAIYSGVTTLAKELSNGQINPNIELGNTHSIFNWKLSNGSLINLAAYYAHWDMVNLLLECHASPQLLPTDQTSVLGWTILWGNQAMFEKVLRCDIMPEKDHTLLWAACASKDPIFFMEKVLGFGHSVNAISPDGLSLLETAVSFNNLDLVKFLVRNGAKIGYVDIMGRTAITLARQLSLTEITRFLIEEEAVQNDNMINLNIHPNVVPPLTIKTILKKTEDKLCKKHEM
mgnify:CR=1 FL=1